MLTDQTDQHGTRVGDTVPERAVLRSLPASRPELTEQRLEVYSQLQHQQGFQLHYGVQIAHTGIYQLRK